jgi:hypothetical protein
MIDNGREDPALEKNSILFHWNFFNMIHSINAPLVLESIIMYDITFSTVGFTELNLIRIDSLDYFSFMSDGLSSILAGHQSPPYKEPSLIV